MRKHVYCWEKKIVQCWFWSSANAVLDGSAVPFAFIIYNKKSANTAEILPIKQISVIHAEMEPKPNLSTQ